MKRSASLLVLWLVACRRDPDSLLEMDSSSTKDDSTPTSTDMSPTDATVDGMTASSSDTGPVCPSECEDPMRPVCDPTLGMCVPCNEVQMPDEACADADPEHPLCGEGPCVQCTEGDAAICTAQGLLCDAPSGTCVPCTEHEQCEVGACALAEGKCFPADATVLHVDSDLDAPEEYFASVGAAVNTVTGGVGVIVVHELDGGASYQGPSLHPLPVPSRS